MTNAPASTPAPAQPKPVNPEPRHDLVDPEKRGTHPPPEPGKPEHP